MGISKLEKNILLTGLAFLGVLSPFIDIAIGPQPITLIAPAYAGEVESEVIEQDGKKIMVLRPEGRLDITTAWSFRLKLQETISRQTGHVIVNLSKIHFIDDSGLASLVAGMSDADKISGSFRLAAIHPEALLVFQASMMDGVFEIFDTEEDALSYKSSEKYDF